MFAGAKHPALSDGLVSAAAEGGNIDSSKEGLLDKISLKCYTFSRQLGVMESKGQTQGDLGTQSRAPQIIFPGQAGRRRS